jgi:hypothetical protein
MPRLAVLASCLLLTLACGEDGSRRSEPGATFGGVDVSTTGGGADDDGAGDSTGDRLDLGDDSGGGPMVSGCNKIDFLFVVDNSQSMEDEQANLVTSFPSFIDGIASVLEGVGDFHVGVVTSDTYSPNATACRHLGGLVVQTGGAFSSDAVCGPYAAGYNYMTEQDDLASSFSCAARVGASGQSIERPMEAMEAAVTGQLDGPGECNEGFLRDDALLVLVIITDEWDGPGDPEGQTSAGSPESWHQTVIDAKGGPTQVAAVTLVNDGVTCVPPEPFNSGIRQVEFTALFGGNGFLGGVCEPDYGPVFSEAIGVVAEACAGFVPAG